MEAEGWQEVLSQIIAGLKEEDRSPARLLLEHNLRRLARRTGASAGLVILEGEGGVPEVVCRLGPAEAESRLREFWPRLPGLERPTLFAEKDPHPWDDPAIPYTLVLPLRQEGRFLGTLALGLAVPPDEAGQDEEEEKAVVLILELEARHRRTARLLRESQALLQISQALSRSASMEEMLGLVIQAVVENIPAAEAGVLHLLEGQVLVPMGTFHPFLSPDSRIQMRLGVGLAGAALQEGHIVRVDDVTADPRFLPGRTPPSYRSLLIAPMEVSGRKLGTLSLQSDRVAAFTPDDARFLSILAGYAAMIVENGRLLEELRRRVEELGRAQDYLVRSEKLAALGRLVASVAHEINNPLEGIKNFLALLSRRLAPDDPNLELVRLLEVGYERIHRTVSQMLDLARREEAARRPCDLGEIVGDALSLLRNRLVDEHIEARVELPAALPPVWVSPPRLEQALTSLFLNAIEAMAGKGGLLEVRGWEDGGQVRLSIRDTGPGIPEEVRDRLFEPFVTTKRNGSGLGLWGCYSILAEHGGTIEVESESGRGTTFLITLPAWPARQEAGEPESASR